MKKVIFALFAMSALVFTVNAMTSTELVVGGETFTEVQGEYCPKGCFESNEGNCFCVPFDDRDN